MAVASIKLGCTSRCGLLDSAGRSRLGGDEENRLAVDGSCRNQAGGHKSMPVLDAAGRGGWW